MLSKIWALTQHQWLSILCSCVYPPNWSELAVGTWNLDPNCDDISVPFIGDISLNDQMPSSVDVQSAGNGVLFIDFDV